MRKPLWLLVVVACSASVAAAGPNAGGVLVVHDTGLRDTAGDAGPPFGGPVPTSCADVDVQAPLDGVRCIWKIYAAFPTGSSPRLNALAFGEGLAPMGDGYITMSAGAMVNAADFEVSQDGWPLLNDGSVGLSFPSSGTKTTLMTEVYWFYGYAYGGLSGTAVQYFCAKPHRVQASVFVDDAPIRRSDPIAGYGCLGFGGPGHAPCPVPPQPTGACCAATGTCAVTEQEQCTGTWSAGSACSPNPCPQPTGACCWNGHCWVEQESQCASMYGTTWTMSGACVPNVCPQPPGRCCHLDGTCAETTEAECTGGVWEYYGSCDPNPCLQPGACCDFTTHGCVVSTPAGCTNGYWIGGACSPNLCFSTPIERKSWGQIKSIFR